MNFRFTFASNLPTQKIVALKYAKSHFRIQIFEMTFPSAIALTDHRFAVFHRNEFERRLKDLTMVEFRLLFEKV